MEEYLQDRDLTVKVSEVAVSSPFAVPSGFPQCSHLSPILFKIFINDISRVLTTGHIMFAEVNMVTNVHCVRVRLGQW